MQHQESIRFTTLDEFAQYLENLGKGQLDFTAYPIAGEPESFHYDGVEQIVTRQPDGKTFDNVEDFLRYAFQCDPEGYANTEYVDVKVQS
ncbi:hypothetical protein [Desulforamulus ferrireducens]|uniref:Uncharacterized protein n=1 Tax=Desulforamulus ferrireducens TaxID=1833852 RepID=A0A1S6IVU9_9FIRM|nr:hypothetical protein [Desulforamulus ferrireducens]AQS58902.1 hypothetical protein B0537_07275 [Desulforamulus ferrireducens]